MKKEADDRTLHRLAMAHDIVEMRQCSQNLRAIQKKSRDENKQRTGVGYIVDTEEMVTASWSLLQHDAVAAFSTSGVSPLLPPLGAKNIPGVVLATVPTR